MTISEEGKKMIGEIEGFRDTAYKCLPTEQYYTIGFGHYGADVKKGQKITLEEGYILLEQDLQKAMNNVNIFHKIYNFTQNQFDALVSFAFNVGSINQLTQSGTRTIRQISEMIPAYNKSGGKVVNGLIKRREKEKALFDGEGTTNTIKTNTELAREVLDGKWGNGTERKDRLTKAGYIYVDVQKIVNQILTGKVV